MQCTSQSKQRQSGFTLIEMLVVAPLLIIFIGIMIGLIGNITSDSLRANTKNELIYNAQAALDEVEATSRLAVEPTRFNYAVPNPTWSQRITGENNVGTPDVLSNLNSNTNLLSFKTAGTTMNPTDPARTLVMLTDCSTPYPVYIVYYVDKQSQTLYKRSLPSPTNNESSPQAATCAGQALWQRRSCSYTLFFGITGSCSNGAVRDDLVAENVRKFQVSYPSDGSIRIELELMKVVSGAEVNNSSVLIIPQ